MTTGIKMGNVKGEYIITASLTPVAVNTIVTAEQTFTVTGLKVGDFVQVNPPAATVATALCAARVSAADTLALTFVNPTAGSVTPTAGTYVIKVSRPEALKTYIAD